MNRNATNRNFVAVLALLFAANGVASEWHPEVACNEGFDNNASLQGNDSELSLNIERLCEEHSLRPSKILPLV